MLAVSKEVLDRSRIVNCKQTRSSWPVEEQFQHFLTDPMLFFLPPPRAHKIERRKNATVYEAACEHVLLRSVKDVRI